LTFPEVVALGFDGAEGDATKSLSGPRFEVSAEEGRKEGRREGQTAGSS